MLTLKKDVFDYGGRDKDIFIMLSLDTEDPDARPRWERLLGDDLNRSKPWIGEVDTNEKNFSIKINSSLQNFKGFGSQFIIKGRRKKVWTKDVLEIRYEMEVPAIVLLLLAVFQLASFGLSLSGDSWALIISVLVWTLIALTLVAGFRSTVEHFEDYLDRHAGNDRTRIRSAWPGEV